MIVVIGRNRLTLSRTGHEGDRTYVRIPGSPDDTHCRRRNLGNRPQPTPERLDHEEA